MVESEQAPSATEVQSRRRRWTWFTVLTIALVSGSALFAIPAIAKSGDSQPAPAPAHKVVVCESEVVDHGDGILTQSATATRAPADAPVPEGCTAE